MRRKGFERWLLILPAVLAARSAFGFEVSPVRHEKVLTPGTTQTAVYFIDNPTEQAVELDMQVKEWRVYPWNQGVALQDWLTLPEPEAFELPPHGRRELAVQVKAPEQASGELAAMIFFSERAPSAQVRMKFGVSLYVMIAGTERAQAEVEKINVRQEKRTERGKTIRRLEMSVVLKNSGNVHLRPDIRAEIRVGQNTIAVPFQYGWPVYPNEANAYAGSAELPRLLKPGKYPAVVYLREKHWPEELRKPGTIRIGPGNAEFTENTPAR